MESHTPQERFNYLNKTGKLPPGPKPKTNFGILYFKGARYFGPALYSLCQHKKNELINLGYFRKDLQIKKHIT